MSVKSAVQNIFTKFSCCKIALHFDWLHSDFFFKQSLCGGESKITCSLWKHINY